MSNLKWGYSTGVHASFAFRMALEAFLVTSQKSISITKKMENDDLDVTKGCEIIVTISNRLEDLELNEISHKPYIIDELYIYSGVGVGVVTKDGLKPKKNYPAINPIPLQAIAKIYKKFGKNSRIFATISVTDGEKLAKQTANSKVGVLGGISILGTTGFVKPISASAYINSIETELKFTKANSFNQVVLTLGNSSFEYAQKYYVEEQIVEIGNFVYDSFKIAEELKFDEVTLICGIGKAVKVVQGHKNTHNRFGSIDFVKLKSEIETVFNIEINIDSIKTVRGIASQIGGLYSFMELKAKEKLKIWFPKLNIDVKIL